MKPLRAVVYCRISTAEDIQPHSLESQRKYYESFIEAHPGYVLAGIYADTASETKRRGRLQFTKMIQDCRKEKIDIILTKSISRFARNSLEFLTTIRELKAFGVNVYFENEKILLNKERNEFRMTTLAAVAQEESLIKSRSIRWALNVGFTTGTSKLANRPCYGYVNDDNGELVIDPASAETVKMIFRLYLDGRSLSGIAKELYRLRIPSPTGKETWTACAIDKVLSNEKYVGIVLLQKTYVPDVLKGIQVKNNGEQARYLYENNHIRIIGQETFDAVQVMLFKRRRKNGAIARLMKKASSREKAYDILPAIRFQGKCNVPNAAETSGALLLTLEKLFGDAQVVLRGVISAMRQQSNKVISTQPSRRDLEKIIMQMKYFKKLKAF